MMFDTSIRKIGREAALQKIGRAHVGSFVVLALIAIGEGVRAATAIIEAYSAHRDKKPKRKGHDGKR